MEKLQNEYLTVEVSDLGAELQSIKDADDKEYLGRATTSIGADAHRFSSL